MSTSIDRLQGMAFLPYEGMKDLMLSEFRDRFGIDTSGAEYYGDLVYLKDCTDRDKIPYWCRCCMKEPFILHFDSIGEAASVLKGILRSWAPYQYTCFRRASLIQDKLPYVNLKKRKFPFEIPHNPIGLYTLIDDHTLIASSVTSSPLPAGSLVFEEDHENPPSRAYLKIQESLTLAHYYFGIDLPKEGQRCFEAGACPGGWTWVIAGLGSSVYAVDRAPLAQSLMDNPLVTFNAHDAFTLKPEDLGEFDWVFSDVICYPERLLGWIKMWLASGKTKNMICTIKMQGAIDWNLIKEFEAIPDSMIVHLNYNKHELTFIHVSGN